MSSWWPSRPQGGTTRSAWLLAASSYGTAHSGHRPSPSSTHSHVVTRGTRSRMRSIVPVKVPWKTTATQSALSHR